MATWQGLNVNTGQVEGPKYDATGVTAAIYSVALTTALANGDVIEGPTVPAGVFLTDVVVDVASLDSNVTPTLTFECGTATTPAQFIASGNTTAQAGGVAHANVAGTVGTTFSTPTAIQVTITHAAATAKADTMTIMATYTATP